MDNIGGERPRPPEGPIASSPAIVGTHVGQRAVRQRRVEIDEVGVAEHRRPSVIPEPSTGLLVVSGLAALAVRRRK